MYVIVPVASDIEGPAGHDWQIGALLGMIW